MSNNDEAGGSRCNAPVTDRFPAYAWRDTDCPHRPTLVFPAHFVLTRAHPRTTSRSVTHPQIALSQARLTLEFFGSGLPEKKVHLVDMSSLSFLFKPGVTALNRLDRLAFRRAFCPIDAAQWEELLL